MPIPTNVNRSPRSFTPPNDVATYRDLLLFEERLKSNAMNLQRRKSKYQLFLIQLLVVIVFLLVEVLLPPQISILAIPYRIAVRKFRPQRYNNAPDESGVQLMVNPYFSTGLLFVSVTTLVLFFASGMYEEKILYANKYVPHANRALRSFNMYLNVRKPPLRSKFRFNPLSFFFPRPPSPPPPAPAPTPPPQLPTQQRRVRSPSAGTSIPIPVIPPARNPRGELIFSSRVDRAFREGYERHRAAFERRREEREREKRGWGWGGAVWGFVRGGWWGGGKEGQGAGAAAVAGTGKEGAGSQAVRGSSSGKTGGRNSKGIVMKQKRRERSMSPEGCGESSGLRETSCAL